MPARVGIAGLLGRGEDAEHQVEIALTSSKITVIFTAKDGQRMEWQIAPEHAEAMSRLLSEPEVW